MKIYTENEILMGKSNEIFIECLKDIHHYSNFCGNKMIKNALINLNTIINVIDEVKLTDDEINRWKIIFEFGLNECAKKPSIINNLGEVAERVINFLDEYNKSIY